MDENVALRKSRFWFHRDDLVENAADALDRLRFFYLTSENIKRNSFVEPAAQQKAEEIGFGLKDWVLALFLALAACRAVP